MLREINTKLNAFEIYTIFKDENEDYNLWVDYKGLTTWFSDYTQFDSKGKENLTYEEVKTLLSKFGIELPKKANFEDNGKGNYSISLEMVKYKDNYLDGQLTCEISENNTISNFNNKIISYKPYKEYNILSLKDAYDKILKGEFRLNNVLRKDSNMNVTNAKLTYVLDSKGFYQMT